MDKQLVSTQTRINFEKQSPKPALASSSVLPWIEVAKGAPYFVTENGDDWTPIGQNDAITWPELQGLFRRKDLATAETYLRMLSAHGVTCLRLMMEYCHGENRYFENPAGRFNPNMVRLWDDIFAMCEKYGLRILLTPYDTFWMWRRWSHHPYKQSNGGPCSKRNQWLLCPDTRNLIKNRLAFATQRWGHSGALFAWDIWNEIHPAHAEDGFEPLLGFVEDVGSALRKEELRLHGRAHPQTVSLFGPTLYKDPIMAECAFRHPALDFASIHFYENNTIDNPKNTVDAAISTGRLTREALSLSTDRRPFFDSEHGPIHSYKDRHKTLSEPFDDEYFRHMQWAHFASGGAGGGMRWPNRRPHSLTAGMRLAQQSLARFLPLINWKQFRRVNLNSEILASDGAFAAFGCGDEEQAVLWLLRTNALNRNGMLNQEADALACNVKVPGLQQGTYRITAWDTVSGLHRQTKEVSHTGSAFLEWAIEPLSTDLAFAIRRTGD